MIATFEVIKGMGSWSMENNTEVMLSWRDGEYSVKHVGWVFFDILNSSMDNCHKRKTKKKKKGKRGGRENLHFIYYLNKQFYAASILCSAL